MESEIKILDHAVDRYLKRIKGVSPEIASEKMRNEAKYEIEEVIESPLVKYHGDKTKPPVHIRGDIAIPVDVKQPSDRRKTTLAVIVPTAYHSETFVDKINDQISG